MKRRPMTGEDRQERGDAPDILLQPGENEAEGEVRRDEARAVGMSAPDETGHAAPGAGGPLVVPERALRV